MEFKTGVDKIFSEQKCLSLKLRTSSYSERREKLQKLLDAILQNESAICEALAKDFAKPVTETLLSEIYPVTSEIRHSIKHLKSWMKTKRAHQPLMMIGAKSFVQPEPKGVTLVLAPWNYPFQLSIAPIVAAIGAGCTVILKPSEFTPATNLIVQKILSSVFSENEVAVVFGAVPESTYLLSLAFDHIFFTGSPAVGKIVMQAAAKNLASVTLELGGKSPCLVDENCDLDSAVESVLWGKLLNAGQTCIAPDYVFVHQSIAQAFYDLALKKLAAKYEVAGSTEASPDLARIITEKQLERLKSLIESGRGADSKVSQVESDAAKRFLAPVLVMKPKMDSALMKEEIFGPVLPILTYHDVEEAIRFINAHEKPLALYIFSKDKSYIKNILTRTSSGGVSVNATLLHLGNPDLPFGGVNHSGIGSYHGIYGFEAFSHLKGIFVQGPFDKVFQLFYPPYTETIRNVIRWMIKLGL